MQRKAKQIGHWIVNVTLDLIAPTTFIDVLIARLSDGVPALGLWIEQSTTKARVRDEIDMRYNV